METNICDKISNAYFNDLDKEIIGVSYYKSEELFCIHDEDGNLLVIKQQDIPALITMLQSINSKTKEGAHF